MSTCRGCSAELDVGVVGCPGCSPAVDPEVLSQIEATPEWAKARVHRVTSRRGNLMLLFGGVVVVALVLLWPSYSAAVDAGDSSGRPLVIIGALLAATFFGVGVHAHLTPLRPYAAVVITTTSYTTEDSEGSSSTNYYLHIQTRTRPFVVSAEYEQVKSLALGEPVIVFVRGSYLETIWRVTIADPSAPT